METLIVVSRLCADSVCTLGVFAEEMGLSDLQIESLIGTLARFGCATHSAQGKTWRLRCA